MQTLFFNKLDLPEPESDDVALELELGEGMASSCDWAGASKSTDSTNGRGCIIFLFCNKQKLNEKRKYQNFVIAKTFFSFAKLDMKIHHNWNS